MPDGRKLLQIIQCTNLAGMERASSERMRGLAEKHNVSFRVASPRQRGKGAFLFDRFDSNSRYFNYRGKFNVIGHAPFSKCIREIAREADSICVTGTCASSLFAANGTGKPVVLDHHYHHGSDWISRTKWRAFYETLGRGLKAVVYVAPFIRDEAVAIAPWLEERAHVIRQTVPVIFESVEMRRERQLIARERLGLPRDAFIVGNGGWLIRRKRFDIFLEVAAKVKKQLPNAYFVICGGGELSLELKSHAAKLNLNDSVRFEGWVSDLTSYYFAWDAMLFNTDFDANPRTPLEAIACGLPIVASSAYGGLSEFFIEPGNGFFYPSHEVSKMADNIVELATNPCLYDSVQKSALERLKAVYNENEELERFNRILFE